MDDAKYDLLLKKLAIKYKKPVFVIKKIVESQFEFINETIQQIDFKSIKSKEEFDQLEVNFNVKHLFNFHTDYETIYRINNRKYASKSSHTKESREVPEGV